MGRNKRDMVVMNASLKKAGVRITKQRLALLSVLTDAIYLPDPFALLQPPKKYRQQFLWQLFIEH